MVANQHRIDMGTDMQHDEATLDQPAGEQAPEFSAVDKAAVIEALARLLPAGALLYDTEQLRPYECDGLSVYRQLPLAVVLPHTEVQVVKILRCC